MDRKSLASTGGRSKRSRTATPGARRSKSGSKSVKSFRSRKSRKSGGKYSKLNKADEIEMEDFGKRGGEFENFAAAGVKYNNNEE